MKNKCLSIGLYLLKRWGFPKREGLINAYLTVRLTIRVDPYGQLFVIFSYVVIFRVMGGPQNNSPLTTSLYVK